MKYYDTPLDELLYVIDYAHGDDAKEMLDEIHRRAPLLLTQITELELANAKLQVENAQLEEQIGELETANENLMEANAAIEEELEEIEANLTDVCVQLEGIERYGLH